MTPELLGLIGSLLDRYGLPISLLIGLGWLLLTRRLVLGSELNYVEDRRKEERDGRLAAELALREQTEALRILNESVTERFGLTKDPPRAARR